VQKLQISSRHAGGNIRVVGKSRGVVELEQELRDTSGWWFYWNFCAESKEERTVSFRFVNGEVVGPWGPAISFDGIEWSWLGAESAPSRQEFIYRFRANEKVYFSFCLPYQISHFERFYEQISPNRHVRRKVLAISEQLRPIPLLSIGNPSAEQHLVFTCRHHSCESTPAYVIEGILESILTASNPSFLQNYCIHYIPFIDIDGVENGDQGKNRIPHDHNRDYTGAPIYRVTSAVMNYVEPFAITAAIDFHGPYKWGGGNDVPFVVRKGSPIKEECERFGAYLEQMTTDLEISYDPRNDIELGEGWNQPGTPNCSSFFEKHGAKLACSLEFPYFGREGAVVTVQSARTFGASFAQALEAYLSS